MDREGFKMIPDEERLKSILSRMDVPETRKTDLRWLLRNLGIRNKNHPDFLEAMGLIGAILSNKGLK
jgi:hypothetical protein